MFDYLVAILQVAYYLTLFVFMPVTLIMRIFIVYRCKNPVFHRVLVVLDVTSLSYFLLCKEEAYLRKTYATLMYIFFVFSFLALAFGIHVLV